MATLSIKNVPDELYERLRARARRNRRSIAQEVLHTLSESLEERKTLSILDLRGLGKEHWRSTDAAGQDSERASWDG